MSEILVDSTWPSLCHLLQWHLAATTCSNKLQDESSTALEIGNGKVKLPWNRKTHLFNHKGSDMFVLKHIKSWWSTKNQGFAQHFIQNHMSFQFCGNSADFIYSSESWTSFIQGCFIWSPWDLLWPVTWHHSSNVFNQPLHCEWVFPLGCDNDAVGMRKRFFDMVSSSENVAISLVESSHVAVGNVSWTNIF